MKLSFNYVTACLVLGSAVIDIGIAINVDAFEKHFFYLCASAYFSFIYIAYKAGK